MSLTKRPVFVHQQQPQGGFTLLEVLIAIVIFSIGLFGIAGLQASGMRYTQSSQLRLVAVAQAEAMADRMRANPAGFVEGHYNLMGVTLGGNMPVAFPTNCLTAPVTASCNRQDLAIFDLVTWNARSGATDTQGSNADVLPSGTGAVCLDSTPNDGNKADWKCDNTGVIYVIKVQWTERSTGEDDLVDTDDDGDAEVGDTGIKHIFVRVTPYADMAVDGI